MKVYIVLSMSTHWRFADTVKGISAVFCDRKEAKAFCDEKNKRAKSLNYIIVSKVATS